MKIVAAELDADTVTDSPACDHAQPVLGLDSSSTSCGVSTAYQHFFWCTPPVCDGHDELASLAREIVRLCEDLQKRGKDRLQM